MSLAVGFAWACQVTATIILLFAVFGLVADRKPSRWLCWALVLPFAFFIASLVAIA